LELIPYTTHPMDMMRTACSMLGTLEPESENPKDKNEKYNQLEALS
jgi:2-methylcitrate synthase